MQLCLFLSFLSWGFACFCIWMCVCVCVCGGGRSAPRCDDDLHHLTCCNRDESVSAGLYKMIHVPNSPSPRLETLQTQLPTACWSHPAGMRADVITGDCHLEPVGWHYTLCLSISCPADICHWEKKRWEFVRMIQMTMSEPRSFNRGSANINIYIIIYICIFFLEFKCVCKYTLAWLHIQSTECSKLHLW